MPTLLALITLSAVFSISTPAAAPMRVLLENDAIGEVIRTDGYRLEIRFENGFIASLAAHLTSPEVNCAGAICKGDVVRFANGANGVVEGVFANNRIYLSLDGGAKHVLALNLVTLAFRPAKRP